MLFLISFNTLFPMWKGLAAHFLSGNTLPDILNKYINIKV